MLSFYQLFLIAFIQGLTEFMPISSSGHLVLLPEILHWPSQGLEMDVAVHMGTLGAVFVYFWRDIWGLLKGFVSLLGGKVTGGGILFLQLSLATVPSVLFGLFLSQYGLEFVRALHVIGWTTLGYGLLLWVSDQWGPCHRHFKEMTLFKAFFIGIAQALALIPGTSRSGICMTMARFLGFDRKDAARFAFLLSVPAILAAGTHTGFKMVMEGRFSYWSEIAIGAFIALISGLVAINFMMKWLQRRDYTPFVLYRLCLGGGILVWGYFLKPF